VREAARSRSQSSTRNELWLSDLEQRFICSACGKRGADVRPDFNWNAKPMMGYR
jgi:hypothetical protein